jgi:spermidine/putrescine transport system substrate-binding protein
MKRIISIVLCIALLASVAAVFVGCKEVPREDKLLLYMPGQYIDEDIFEDFEKGYKEKTGKKIVVEVVTFSTVEDVQKKVESGKADYDLLCPSDYMVEYLIKKGLVEKVNVDVKSIIRDDYLKATKQFDPTLEYAVPYMYGTLGLMYDYRETKKHITSWEDYFGDSYKGNGTRSLKLSPRDAYAAACLYNARNKTKGLEGDAMKQAIQAVFEDASAETIAAAKTTLKSVISGGAAWDEDLVKYEMAQDNSDVKVALMWSCDAGYVMKDYEDDDGYEFKGNTNLWYVVPEEGGNVYIDAFVINKYAVNKDAAQEFLAYLCRKEIAVANSEYAGAVSPVKEAYDEMLESFDEEVAKINASAEWKAMYKETMFPSAKTLNRCGVMKDFGDRNSAVTEMFSSLRAN